MLILQPDTQLRNQVQNRLILLLELFESLLIGHGNRISIPAASLAIVPAAAAPDPGSSPLHYIQV